MNFKRLSIYTLLLSALLGFLFVSNNSKKAGEIHEISQKKDTPAASRIALSNKIRSSIINEPRVIEKKDSAPTECKEWNEILELSLTDSENINLPNPSGCTPPSKYISMQQNAYIKNCITEGSIKDPNCESMIYFYRAALVDWATKDLDIDNISDPKIIWDKLISSFFQNNPDKTEKLSLRLMRLEPDLYEPVKFLAGAQMMKVVEAENSGQEFDWDRVSRTIQMAEEFQKNDPELIELKIFGESRGLKDLDRAQTKLDEESKKFPNQAVTDYLRAGILWKEKNRDAAIEYLKKALQKDPKNERFKKTWDAIQKDPATNDPVFSISLNMSLKLRDTLE